MTLAVDVATIGGVYEGMRVLCERDTLDLQVMRELTTRTLIARQEERREQAILGVNEYAAALERGRKAGG